MTAADIGSFLWVHYHKDWVDVGTFIVAGVYASYKAMRAGFDLRPTTFGRYILDGSALFPLILLSMSVFSRHLIEDLLSASRVTLSIAGSFALLAILESDRRP